MSEEKMLQEITEYQEMNDLVGMQEIINNGDA